MPPPIAPAGRRRFLDGRGGAPQTGLMASPPRWVVSNAESVRREATRYIDMPDEQRLGHLAAACRAAARLLALRADRQRALAHRDPLPESTILALARLRARARSEHGGGTD